jgi:hypothetical protein
LVNERDCVVASRHGLDELESVVVGFGRNPRAQKRRAGEVAVLKR